MFLHGTDEQFRYVIENYPKIEGVKTYFITGPKDETHLKKNKIDIGQLISNERDDMIYIGRNEKEITIDNTSIKIANLKAKKTYTVSYRYENLVKSIRSEDKSDILLYGGLLQQDKFKYRDIYCISVPSVCSTTPEIKDKYSNIVGSWYLDITTDEKGRLKKLLATSSPNYVTAKDEYKKIKPKNICLNMNKESTNIKNDFNLKYAEKIFRICKNGMTLDELSKILNYNLQEAMGLIEFCKMYYLSIDLIYNDSSNNYIIKKSLNKKPKIVTKEDLSQLKYLQLLTVSDTHLGNNFQQLHLLNELYKEAYNRGVTTALHIGDVNDGDYSKRRSEHPYQVFLHGFDEQVEYVCDMYPYIKGLKTYYILGSYDETHQKNGEARLNTSLSRTRDDMIFLGQD